MTDKYDYDGAFELVKTIDGRWIKRPIYDGEDYEDEEYDEPDWGEDTESDSDCDDEDEEEIYPYLPDEYRQLKKRQNAARIVQTATTAGGALVGTALGGPWGGALGGAAGAAVGEAVSPTPGTEWNFGRVAPKMVWGAAAGGLGAWLSPYLLAGSAPFGSGVLGGISGWQNARR